MTGRNQWKVTSKMKKPRFLARKELTPAQYTTVEGGDWNQWNAGPIKTSWLREWPGKAARKNAKLMALKSKRKVLLEGSPWSLRKFCSPTARHSDVEFHSLRFSENGVQCYWDSLNGFRHSQWWRALYRKYRERLRKLGIYYM